MLIVFPTPPAPTFNYHFSAAQIYISNKKFDKFYNTYSLKIKTIRLFINTKRRKIFNKKIIFLRISCDIDFFILLQEYLKAIYNLYSHSDKIG